MRRKSKQRSVILDVLVKANRPLSIKEILEHAEKKSPQLGIATVYRAIKNYLQSEDVSQVELPGNIQRYEIKHQSHYHHFWCRVCDQVFRIEGCPGKLNFSPPKGFKAEMHDVTFKGVCVACC